MKRWGEKDWLWGLSFSFRVGQSRGMETFQSFAIRPFLACLAFAASAVVTRPAEAQIKEPGAHPDYSVELEPHFVFQLDHRVAGTEGIGLGARASIPLMQNGPVPKINNNFAIGFGLDWAHFGNDNCWGWGYYGPIRGNFFNAPGFSCSGNSLWFPVVVQWNFFFTPVVGAFAELGLGIFHDWWSLSCDPGFAGCPIGPAGYSVGYSDTGVWPMFAIGPRFLLADSFDIIIRIGIPYLSVGPGFLL
jgi:hypothetical protein